jgi:hypothetical protein
MENSRFLCYVTYYHGPLNGVPWLHVPDQVVWQGAGSMLSFSILRFPRICICLTLLFLLSGGMVHLPHSVTPRGPHRTVKLWFLFSVVVVIGLDGQTDIFRVWSPEE